MRIDSSGNVGIGTSSPYTYNKLTVLNGAITSGTANSTNGSTLLQGLYSSGTITNIGTEFSSGGPVIGYAVTPSTSASDSFVSSSSGNLFKGAYTIAGNVHKWYGGAASTTAIGSAVTTSELMRIDSSGNVGIGTSTATYKLTINTAVTQAESTTGLAMQLNNLNATAVSAGILNINSNDSQAIDLGGSITFGGNYISTSSGISFAGIAGRKENSTSSNTAGYLQFTTRNDGGNTTERMRIDSSGNLLVGATSSGLGTTRFYVGNNGTNITTLFAAGTGTAASTEISRYYHIAATGATSATMLQFLNSSGAGVGTITSNGTATLYNTSSDKRLKENIVDASSALSLINSVKVRSFDFKSDGSHIEFGLIAQEFYEVAPQCVSKGDNEEEIKQTWGLDASALVPAMIKAIQEQQAMITNLSAQVTALQLQIDTMQ
jgi:hypothetical protein